MGSLFSLKQSLKTNWMITASLGSGLLLATIATASAQQTVYVGQSGGQSVVVDLQAIDGAPSSQQSAFPGLNSGLDGLSRYHYSGRSLKWPEPEMLNRSAPAPSRSSVPATAAVPAIQPTSPVEPEPDSGSEPMVKEVPAPAPVAPVEVTEETVTPEPSTGVASGMPEPSAPASQQDAVPAPSAAASAAPTALKPAQAMETVEKIAAVPSETETVSTNAEETKTDLDTVNKDMQDTVAAVAPDLAVEPPKVAEPAPQSPSVPLEGITTILFGTDGESVPDSQKSTLDRLAAGYASSEDRIQLKAYAGTESTNNSLARRLSLKRALAVRSYLMDAGIRGKRIDVRALGISNDGGPADRVEITTAAQ